MIDESVILMKTAVPVDEVWNLLKYSTIWNNLKRWGLHGNLTIGTTLKRSITIFRDNCWMKMFHYWTVLSSPRNQSGNKCIETVFCNFTRIDSQTCCVNRLSQIGRCFCIQCLEQNCCSWERSIVELVALFEAKREKKMLRFKFEFSSFKYLT